MPFADFHIYTNQIKIYIKKKTHIFLLLLLLFDIYDSHTFEGAGVDIIAVVVYIYRQVQLHCRCTPRDSLISCSKKVKKEEKEIGDRDGKNEKEKKSSC